MLTDAAQGIKAVLYEWQFSKNTKNKTITFALFFQGFSFLALFFVPLMSVIFWHYNFGIFSILVLALRTSQISVLENFIWSHCNSFCHCSVVKLYRIINFVNIELLKIIKSDNRDLAANFSIGVNN